MAKEIMKILHHVTQRGNHRQKAVKGRKRPAGTAVERDRKKVAGFLA
jgi:hypothetical protein